MLEQSSSFDDEEVEEEMMNIQEVARTIEWFKAKGLTAEDVNEYLTYVATGVGLPTNDEPDNKES